MTEPELPVHKVDGTAAAEPASVVSAILDLEYAIEAAARLLERFPADAPDEQPAGMEHVERIELVALWHAALIAYFRAYSEGVPGRRLSHGLPAQLQPEAGQGHRELRAMRDKHVAHSVSSFEQVQIGAVLAPADNPTRVEGVGPFHMRLVLPGREWVQLLLDLALLVRRHLTSQLDALYEAVQHDAERRVETIKHRPRLRITAPGAVEKRSGDPF